MTACHRLRGGILGCRFVVPACRRHPGRRNTGLRTAPTAYRGWKLPRLWSSSADGGVAAMGSYAGWCFSTMTYCKKWALLREGAGHRDTSSVKRLLHYY